MFKTNAGSHFCNREQMKAVCSRYTFASKFTSTILRFTFICLIVFNFTMLFAQENEIKWGEIPRADLEMTAFPDDSNAMAVILADIGRVWFTDEFNLVFERHRRIKILSEAGYDWGSFDIPFYAEKGLQRVKKGDVKGHTIFLDENGNEKRVKLNKNSVFEEDIDGQYKRIRFTLPALKPGCVLEYRYKVRSSNPTFLRDWTFQTSEPTRWSEFQAEIPDPLEYVMVWQGIGAFDVEASESLPWPHDLIYSGTADFYNLRVTKHRWCLRNTLALRNEPFMTTPEDFRAKIRFQLARIHWPNQPYTEVMTSWYKLSEELMDSKYFGREIKRHKDLRKQAEKLTAHLAKPEEKLRAIYDYVRTTMTWNGEYGIYIDKDLDDAYKTRSGGGPEIALMLTSMLQFAGLDARPVLISTRNHGRIYKEYPMLLQFNHVLTHVKIGDRDHLLDATDPLRPMNILPVEALNERGFLVDKKNPCWIRIISPGFYSNRTIVTAKMDEDGLIHGWFDSTDDGYSGFFDRQTLRDKKEEAYIRDGWLTGITGAALDSFKISNRDSIYVPLQTKAHFSSADHALVGGDKIYFNPIFFGRREENPFKLEKRAFPVDFAYARKFSYFLYLTLPKGYSVQEMPKHIDIRLPENSGQFLRQIYVNGNQLQLLCDFVVVRSRFEPHEYDALRDFYNRVVAAQAEQIVLQKQDSMSNGKEKTE